MSIECNNTAPLASKNSDELLTTTSDALVDAILDLQKLADESASNLNTGNRKAITNLTNGLNNILTNTNIDEFPHLKDAVAGGAGLSTTDIADFVAENNANVEELQAAIDDFNTNNPSLSSNRSGDSANQTPSLAQLLQDSLSNSIANDPSLATDTGTTSGLLGNIGGVTGGATGSGATLNPGSGPTTVLGDSSTLSTTQFPSADDTNESTSTTSGEGSGVVGNASIITGSTPSPSSEAIKNTQYGASGGLDADDQFNLLLGSSATLFPAIMYNLLKDLDFNFAVNLGQELTGTVCGVYNDVLKDVTKAFAVVNTGKALLSQVENLLEKDVKKLAESIKQKGVLETLMDILKTIIQESVEAARKAAQIAIGAVAGAVYGMAKASMAVLKKTSKIIQDINNYMQNATVQSMIADMEKVLAELASSFERLTPQNIANIMFRLCQMARDLQGILMAPALKMQTFAGSIASEAKVLKSQSAKNTQNAVKYGALRISEEDRKAKKDKVIEKASKVSPTNLEADVVFPAGITQQEMGIITGVTTNPEATELTPYLPFSSKVISGKEFQDVNPLVWTKLLRLQGQTGETYEIKSAKSAKKKGKKLGSIGMTAHDTGWAVDIMVSESIRNDTIVAASRAGFGGIGVYTSHIHLDLASRRSWTKVSNEKVNSLLDKHNIDGFRKKRT